jgi:hypothetical protein
MLDTKYSSGRYRSGALGVRRKLVVAKADMIRARIRLFISSSIGIARASRISVLLLTQPCRMRA